MTPSRSLALAAVLGLGASALATVGTGSLQAPAEASGPGALSSRPNVVMITADDASVGDLRWMPHTRALLQQQGVTLTDAIAPTPICVPARASLLTGQYADNHGAVTISGPRGGFAAFRDRNTLPVWLRQAGYSTMFVGKYLNGYGRKRNRNYVPPGWSDWRATTAGTYRFFNTTFNVNGRQRKSRGYSTSAITSHAAAMLDRQHRRTPSRPFLMWVNYVGPHHGGPPAKDDPRRRWPGDRSVWLSTTTPAPKDTNAFKRLSITRSPDLWERNTRGNRFAGPKRSPRYKAAMREVFQQRIEALQSVDRGVARLVYRLKANRDLANTYVIFSSDNGYLTGHHNLEGKLVPYDRSLRIPMVIRGPGVPRDRRLGTTVTNPDIAASIARVSGARPGRTLDGVPVFHMLDRPLAIRPIPISGWAVKSGRRGLYRGIRFGDYTYFRSGKRAELYDRSRDPGELTNVARHASYAKRLAMMNRLYRLYAHCRGGGCPKTWS